MKNSRNWQRLKFTVIRIPKNRFKSIVDEKGNDLLNGTTVPVKDTLAQNSNPQEPSVPDTNQVEQVAEPHEPTFLDSVAGKHVFVDFERRNSESILAEQLENLIVFVDNNGLQNDGACRDIMPTQDLRAKFEAFGWEAYRINGHCMEEIVWALDHIRGSNNGKPKAIICNTVKGKSVSFMENVPIWHGLAPNDEQYKIAMEDIERGF